MKEEEYKLFARLRNGVETIPSILKNVYNVNRMSVRGKIHCKFFFGSKVAALNFRKLLFEFQELPFNELGILNLLHKLYPQFFSKFLRGYSTLRCYGLFSLLHLNLKFV